MEFVQPFLDQLIPVLATLVATAIGYGVVLLRKYINKALESEDLAQFRDLVLEYVRYMEQEGFKLHWDNERKFAFVYANLKLANDELGLGLTDEDIKRMIEAFVLVVNNEVQSLPEPETVFIPDPKAPIEPSG